MPFPRVLAISGAIIAVSTTALVGCGDDNGVRSLDEFYRGRASETPAPGGTSTSRPGSTAGSPCDVSTSALLAYLPFEGSVSLGSESSFTATTAAASPSFVGGRVGSALSGSSVVMLQSTSTTTLSSWTACAWIKMSTAPAALIVLNISSPSGSTALGMSGANGSGCSSGESYAPFISGSTGCFTPIELSGSTSWSFVCWVVDSSSSRTSIHVAGSTESNAGASALRLSSGERIQIGSGDSSQSSSAIDELSLWGRALSSSEIQSLGGGGTPCTVTTRGTR